MNFELNSDKVSPSTLRPVLNVFDGTGNTSATILSVTAANPFMMMTVRTSMLRPGWFDAYVARL
jgi:hypothetical protein